MGRLFRLVSGIACAGIVTLGAAEGPCSYATQLSDLALREYGARQGVASRLKGLPARAATSSANAPVEAATIPHRNLVDSEIFGTLISAKLPVARLATDEEFVRRIYLDLTGYLPSGDQVAAFLADRSGDKRGRLIATLVNSPEFVDRWTMWLGDLFENTSQSSNVNRQAQGRNAFHSWIRDSLNQFKSVDRMVVELLTARGNTYGAETGAANYLVGGVTPMGPPQDTYDTLFAQNARRFLGMAQYDCILCHDGQRRLEQLSLYFGQAKRADAQRMAAFFARVRFQRPRVPQEDPLFNSFDVSDQPRGDYLLNTDFGNRPARRPIEGNSTLTPRWRDGRVPASDNLRAEAARFLTTDPMFAVNIVNRVWKHFFGMALVEPVDGLDPARLDPDNPPADPWRLQATHPRLLVRLAEDFRKSGHNLRDLIRLIADSSAYQLSSHYDGEWSFESIPLFARHYPRRLEGEEIHDAIAKATGLPAVFRMRVRSGPEPPPVRWAVQLPEPSEPRGDRNALLFMNTFFRGDRDLESRSQDNSILQRMALMNDPIVLMRLRAEASPTLNAIVRIPDNARAIETLWLQFLSRRPTDRENTVALAYLARPGMERAQAIEDLAWALVNKVDFLYSY